MHKDRPSKPEPAAALDRPAEEQLAAPADERICFLINESAYAQHLGLIHWNDSDHWYHGNAKR